MEQAWKRVGWGLAWAAVHSGIGRRTIIDDALKREAERLRTGGFSLRDIGAQLNVSAATVHKALGQLSEELSATKRTKSGAPVSVC